jgi:hypothetical protein
VNTGPPLRQQVLTVNGNSNIWAHNGADGAFGAFGFISKSCYFITFIVYFIGYGQTFFGAEFNTKSTTFTTIFFEN